ncbi:AfsR/SARP family transcriptional regulator [Plantactinospora sp. WMMB334]|uniref:AfsR/SARP family transcriptional regulator n=1 Tax=Plantactinospora sp. WMMB334 TaxID=3404119 RepID=UPI003B9235C7
MDLRVLGEVQIQTEAKSISLERSAERCVLATLAFSPGRPVRTATLVDNVWGDRQPTKADQTIATYVRAVRRAIEDAGGDRDWLVNRRPRAYELRITPEAVDYHRFTVLASAGRAKAHGGDAQGAVLTYQQALSLWHGEPLANIDGDWADQRRHDLRQAHLETLCALFEQQLKIGDHQAVASNAVRLVNDVVPTDRLIALAVQGLADCGQTSMIPGFVNRAADRMWNTVQVRPGPDVNALVRRLVTRASATESQADRSDCRLPSVAEPDTHRPRTDDEAEGNPDSSRIILMRQLSKGSVRDERTLHSNVTMTATSNGNVYQTAGDQYINET